MCKGGGFPCYAYKLAIGRLKTRYQANTITAPPIGPVSFTILSEHPFYPRFWPERVYEPAHCRKPSKIFVVDMGELFGDWIPLKWQEVIFQTIISCPQHTFQLLTKQPQNLIKWSPFPENCWVGVTITNNETLLRSTTNLGYIDAKVKFISFEPLLERLPLPYYQMNCDWLIIGAQTRPYKSPKIEWIREIVEAADEVGISVFLKDNLKPILPLSKPFYNWDDDFGWKLRQEMPGK